MKTLNRRIFLKTIGLVAAGSIRGYCGDNDSRKEGGKNRPANVLFISIEDLNDWVGCLGGHPNAKTPNLDRLATRGVLFTNAHCSAPACNPSRTSLLTGVRPSTSGAYHNGDPTGEVIAKNTTLPDFFRKQGYFTMGHGKIFHAGKSQQSHFDEYVPAGRNPRPKEAGRYNGNLPPLGGFPLSCEDDDMADAKAAAWATQKLNARYDKPFFLAVGFSKVHRPLWVPRKYFDMFPLDEISLGSLTDNDLEDVPPIARAIARGRWKHGPPNCTDHEMVLEKSVWKANVRAYLACTAFLDAMVGRIIDAIDKSPHRDNTVVVLFSDHGFHVGEKEHWTKFTLWEEATRVPLMFVAPGVTKPNQRCDQPVSLLDIYPTLADLCGLPAQGQLEGVSLLALLKNPGATRQMPALTSYGRYNHSVRTVRWRYTRYCDGTEELYDHDIDPREWKNLAKDPSYDNVKEELAKWLPQTNAVSTNPDPFEVESEGE